MAVDNIAEHLAHNGVKILRIGHPARVAEQVLPHNLDVILQDQMKVVEVTEAKIRNMRKKLEKQCLVQNTKLLTGLQEEMKTTMKQLNIQKKTLNKRMTSMMSNAEVVLGTLTGCGTRSPLKFLPENHFKLTVIDECSQALEMSCWIMIPRSPKLILEFSDHEVVFQYILRG